MKSRKITRSTYTQASSNDVTLYKTSDPSSVPVSLQSSAINNSDEASQTPEIILKNGLTVLGTVLNQQIRRKSDVDTQCHYTQSKDLTSVYPQNNKFNNDAASERKTVLKRSFSALPHFMGFNSDTRARNILTSSKHQYVPKQSIGNLMGVETASLRSMQSPEIVDMAHEQNCIGCGVEHCAMQSCDFQWNLYPDFKRDQTIRNSKRGQRRRPNDQIIDSGAANSEQELHNQSKDCQCACDYVIYSPNAYICLQDERMFAPAPDVTRRMGSATNLANSEHPGSPPYYRSASASSSNSTSSRGGLELTARHWWIILTVFLLAAAVGVGVPIALKISSEASFEERLEFASRLLQETPLIDGHNDLPWNIRKFMHNKLKKFKFDSNLKEVVPWSNSAWSHTDLARLERGNVAAQSAK